MVVFVWNHNILRIGGGKTAMVIFPVSAHIPLLAITEYEVVVAGDTIVADEVAPLLQVYVVPPEAVRVIRSPPQIVALFETVTVGEGITATETESVSVHAPIPAITT